MNAEVLVVGGGAAGILAAWRAAQCGSKVVILEKTIRLGTKILVSGGGKCNITQAGSVEDVLSGFRSAEARFLRPSLYRFPNQAILDLLTAKGLRVYTRPDGRVFPVDQTAKDVVGILESVLWQAGVEIRYQTPVTSLTVENGVIRGVSVGQARVLRGPAVTTGTYRPRTAKNLLKEYERVEAIEGQTEALEASRVIVSCGGSSYPNSGTTGDGWALARQVGHSIVKPRAALAPLYMEEERDLAGVSLSNVLLKARQGKEIARWRGDLLFTHQGLSGPAALGISRTVAEAMEQGDAIVELDLRPDSRPEETNAWLQSFAARHPASRVRMALSDLPERLVDRLLESLDIRVDLPFAQFERKARNRLATALNGWHLGRVRHVPLERGEVVAGGISLDEVDPQTLASKKVLGLFFCGEVLDLAGPVGGYNLQAAFSTGFVAGESAARSLTD